LSQDLFIQQKKKKKKKNSVHCMQSAMVWVVPAAVPRWSQPAVPHSGSRSTGVVMDGARPLGFSLSRLIQDDEQPPRVPSADVPRSTLSYRVRDALLDAEEQPYTIWSEPGSERPLRANLDLLVFRGRTLARQGDREGARATYRRCVSIDPRDGRGWLALARLSEREGRVDEAIDLLKRGLRHEPSNAHVLQAYGAMEERRGNGDEAIGLYTRALQAEPTHAASWVALSLVLQRRRDHAGAWRCLRLASAAEPRSYYVWQVSQRGVRCTHSAGGRMCASGLGWRDGGEPIR
jgi:tetratricopeptide (TPR) repeat protein